jgi:hypothetical protein
MELVQDALPGPTLDATGFEAVTEASKSKGILVPADFVRQIFEHQFANSDGQLSGSAPIIMAIAGPFGTGKSVMLSTCCDLLGIETSLISSSMLQNRWEGAPAELLRETWLEASERQFETGQPSALIIEDVDLILGEWGDSATSNSRGAVCALMELADRPNEVHGQRCDRIPIYITANDISKLYGAVSRPGRMRVFEWNPGPDTVEHIAAHILKGILSTSQIQFVLGRYGERWMPARFGQLRSYLEAALIHRLARHNPLPDLLRDALGGQQISFAPGALSNDDLRRAIEAIEAEDHGKADFTRDTIDRKGP